MPSVSADAPIAQAPTWNEGDGWALGKTVDLDAEFADELEDLENNLTEDFLDDLENATVNEFDIDALTKAYVLMKVADVTDTEVTLVGEVAGSFSGDASISVTADMPKPGTYSEMTEIPNEQRTISADLSVDLAACFSVEIVLQKTNSAIKSVEAEVKTSAAIDARVINFPDINMTARTINYENHDVSLDFNLFMTVRADFSPAVDLFSFPLQVGDQWVVDSDITITGSYGGSLDIRGLPEELEDEIFDSETMQELNITSFPVDFAKVIQNEEDPSMQNGVIGPETVDMDPVNLNCVSASEVQLDNQSAWKYVISVNSGESEYYYYDSNQSQLLGLNKMVNEMVKDAELPFEMPVELPLDDATMEMEEIPVSEAEQGIADISDYRDDIAGGSQGTGIDLMLILGIVAVVAVAAVVVAFLLLRRKPKAL
jgi:hypothetical protein